MQRACDVLADCRVAVAVIDGPVTPEREAAALTLHQWTPARDSSRRGLGGLAGAALRFEGIVRRGEPRESDAGREHDLVAIDYQTYDPMAERELVKLSHSVVERHGLLGLVALHSRGRVKVGEVSFVLMVESAHRAEALAAMGEFIDLLKQDVPIWKRPVWPDASGHA